MSNQKIVVDCAKGTTTYVPLSAAEIAERDQMAAAAAEERSNKEAEEAAKAAAKASAETKLAELGLSADEIAAL
jgi:hypothetical protein